MVMGQSNDMLLHEPRRKFLRSVHESMESECGAYSEGKPDVDKNAVLEWKLNDKESKSSVACNDEDTVRLRNTDIPASTSS